MAKNDKKEPRTVTEVSTIDVTTFAGKKELFKAQNGADFGDITDKEVYLIGYHTRKVMDVNNVPELDDEGNEIPITTLFVEIEGTNEVFGGRSWGIYHTLLKLIGIFGSNPNEWEDSKIPIIIREVSAGKGTAMIIDIA